MGHCLMGVVSINGRLNHVEEYSSSVRSESLAISLAFGMFCANGCKGVWAQKKGLWRTSEKTSSHNIGTVELLSRLRKVERHEPFQEEMFASA